MVRAVAVVFAALCGPALAEPLADMQGAWSGSGWARETPEGPKEAVRCRLKNIFSAGALTVSGRCVVPGRKITLAGEIKGKAGSENVTGHWFNPDGLGSTRISGVQSDDLVAFTFRAKDPETGTNIAQNVEWRVTGDGMRLRATDRADPSIMMSHITFMPVGK
jgi:hypothetical protein